MGETSLIGRMSDAEPTFFKARPLVISDLEPFANDALSRKPIIENLTAFLSSFRTQSFVLGIHGSWGTGKTTLLDMWMKYLHAKNIRFIYFNAWENDFADNPFSALLSEFTKLQSEAGVEKSVLLKAWKGVKKHGGTILKRAAGNLIKSTTAGALDLNSDAESAIGGLAEKITEHAIQVCEESKKSIAAFREKLEEYVCASDADKTPVFYFVDELDRCRPTFALTVLERIKHLMNVPGIVFVFAWDREQLNATIKTVYGSQSDPSGYLLRFIDLEYELPEPDQQQACEALIRRFNL